MTNPTITEQAVEAAARAIMLDDGCGLTINGERAFCDDARAQAPPIEACRCKSAARVALAAALPHLEVDRAEFLTSYFSDCYRAGDRIDPEIGKIFNINHVSSPARAAPPDIEKIVEEIEAWYARASPGPWQRGIGNESREVFNEQGGQVATRVGRTDGSLIEAFHKHWPALRAFLSSRTEGGK